MNWEIIIKKRKNNYNKKPQNVPLMLYSADDIYVGECMIRAASKRHMNNVIECVKDLTLMHVITVMYER